jgi:phosphoribosyl-AMP cyclohydrolase
MHTDCGLAAAALLVENGDDLCCHYGSLSALKARMMVFS